MFVFYLVLQKSWCKNYITLLWTEDQWNVKCRLGLVDHHAISYTSTIVLPEHSVTPNVAHYPPHNSLFMLFTCIWVYMIRTK